MSSRIYFGICPTIPVARNAGQTLNQVQGDKISSLRAVVDRVAIKSTLVLRLAFSCSTRGKRAYVLSALRTPLARAIRDDIKEYTVIASGRRPRGNPPAVEPVP